VNVFALRLQLSTRIDRSLMDRDAAERVCLTDAVSMGVWGDRSTSGLSPSQEVASLSNFPFPIASMLDEINEYMARSFKRFTVETSYGPFYVYVRQSVKITTATGWQPIEGPYPQWSLPERVRWARIPKASLLVEASEAVAGSVQLRCRALLPTQVVVKVNGVVTSEEKLIGDFATFRVPVNLGKGDQSTIELELNATGDQSKNLSRLGILCEKAAFLKS
jgi:hypothetical protein